jgi:outer membrane protein assembly factor BamA
MLKTLRMLLCVNALVCLCGLSMTSQSQQQPRLPSNVIEAIEFRGVEHVSQDTLRALISSKVGDVYDEEAVHRDVGALWNTNRFDDIEFEKETGNRGGIIIRFELKERSSKTNAPQRYHRALLVLRSLREIVIS